MFAINGSSTNQVKSKMDIEHRVVDQFIRKAADLQEVGLGNPKVAFLFLTMSDFPWLKAWEAFFQDAWKKDYSIYVHRAALKDAACFTPCRTPPICSLSLSLIPRSP